jgi:hypothetical protein
MNEDARDDVQRGPQLSDELKRFADDLARLQPRDDRLDRERLAFLAGQASVTPRGRAWPVAFGAMTAVAASLLFLLATQPETSTVGPHTVALRIDDAKPHFATSAVDDRHVLSPRDALRINFEAMLATKASDGAQRETGRGAPVVRQVPTFTPNAWQRVIEESESARPSSNDDSGYYQIEGVRS